MREFLRRESSSGVLVLIAALSGFLFANSPFSHKYFELLEKNFSLNIFGAAVTFSLHHFINEFLMAIFFYVVGLEIKRELTVGHLASRKKAIAPLIAAFGGMALPALIYLAIAGRTNIHGWAIPVATDIALAVGLLSLIGKGAPESIRAFLLALAVIDDIGAILIIALVYASGVHPTLIAVALGLATPQFKGKLKKPLNEKIESALHPYSAFLVIPIFAFANAGVHLNASLLGDALGSPIAWGIFFGLLIGKPVGILFALYSAARTKVAELPEGAPLKTIGATASAAGIGFTVSIFIAHLAFADTAVQDIAVIAVIAGSIASATLSALLFKRAKS